MSKKKRLSVTPVITGIHAQQKRSVLALHYQPKDVLANVRELKDMSEGDIKALFEDVETIISWALSKFHVVKPENEKAPSEDGA